MTDHEGKDFARSRIEKVLGPCPFAKDDERYQAWLTIGIAMLEAHTRFRAEFTERSLNTSTDQLALLAIEAAVRQYDIAATPAVATTTDFASAVEREEWLNELSTWVLNWFTSTINKGPMWMREKISIQTARMRLEQRAQHWTAEALRYAREAAGRVPRPPDAHREIPSRAVSGPPDSIASVLSVRAVWLQDQLDDRQWTVHDVERNNGPAWRTTRKILKGQRVQTAVLEKLAHALSTKGGRIRANDIPDR